MANNRMFLRCKKCGEDFMLCKFYPDSGYYIEDNWKLYKKNFNDFLQKHSFECFGEIKEDIFAKEKGKKVFHCSKCWGNDMFELAFDCHIKD
jgi:hypothetical protein